jgi:hypothetical protein
MASANKFSDTSFLIDLFLSGGQKALDALRDITPGRIFVTSDTIRELEQFQRADISQLKDWISKSTPEHEGRAEGGARLVRR